MHPPIARALGLGLLIAPAALAIGLLPAGCGPDTQPPSPDSGPPGCTLAFLGDKTKDIQLELIALDAAYKSGPIKDGDGLAMLVPPQGGFVVFAGVRATNIDPCELKLTGAVRDPATMQVRVDARTVNLLPGTDGWGVTAEGDIASFANVPVCPNEWASTDIYDQPFELEVTVVEKSKRTATVKAMVKPTCAEPTNLADCRCTCKKGYVLGEMCDSGTSSSSSGGGAGGGK